MIADAWYLIVGTGDTSDREVYGPFNKILDHALLTELERLEFTLVPHESMIWKKEFNGKEIYAELRRGVFILSGSGMVPLLKIEETFPLERLQYSKFLSK